MFTITGIINGESEKLSYDIKDGHGVISGDDMAMFMFKCALERNTPTGPVGQYLDRDIDQPISALFMIMECFEKIVNYEGDLPTASSIPNGAIG